MNQGNIYQGTPFRQEGNGGGDAFGGEGQFNPLSLVRTILGNWKIVMLCVWLGALIGFLYILFVAPVYKATAEVEMSVRQPKVINGNAVFDDSSLARDEGSIFYTRFAKFKSPSMEKLATQEYFNRYPTDDSEDPDAEITPSLLAQLIREVEWDKNPRANIVTVSFSSPSPEFAAKLVNVMTDCAGVLMMQENKAQSDEAVKWLVTQVEETRASLDAVELQRSDLRSELRLDSLQQRKTVLDQSLETVSAEREGLLSTLASRKTVYAFVQKLKGTDPDFEMLPPGLPKEEELNELIQTWRGARDQLSLVASRYTKAHPEYRQSAEAEARARKRLEQFIDLSSKSVENEIELLGKQVEQVDVRIEAIKKESLELEQMIVSGMRQLQRLESERTAADTSYQSMLKRVEEARLSADENMAYTKVIQYAEIPRVPVSPNKPRILILGVFLGGLVGSLIAILVSFLLDSIQSVSELRALRLNVLGIVPSQKKMDSRGELATIGLRDRFNHIVEIFAGMNALFSSDKYRDQAKVLVVCSVMPGEGKTVCACNMAISSALNGARTLLIDGDLRRPQIANIFAVDSNHPSLLEWLYTGNGKINHESLLSRGVVENLDVISSRPFSEINPSELLGRARMKELLDWARSHYDRVVIDSPPMGPVGDAQVLANKADSVVMVARVGKTRKRQLRQVLGRLRELDANILGCIANDVSHSLAGMFAGDEGYGYGYGGYKTYGKE